MLNSRLSVALEKVFKSFCKSILLSHFHASPRNSFCQFCKQHLINNIYLIILTVVVTNILSIISKSLFFHLQTLATISSFIFLDILIANTSIFICYIVIDTCICHRLVNAEACWSCILIFLFIYVIYKTNTSFNLNILLIFSCSSRIFPFLGTIYLM